MDHRFLSTYVEQRPSLSPEQIETLVGRCVGALTHIARSSWPRLAGIWQTYCYYFADSACQSGQLNLVIFGNDASVAAEPPSAAAVELGARIRKAWCTCAQW